MNKVLLFSLLSIGTCFSQIDPPYKADQERKLFQGVEFVQKIADSINSFQIRDSIPNFFIDPRFDFKYGHIINYSVGIYHGVPKSIRKVILDRVTNEMILREVLSRNDSRLHATVKLDTTIKSAFYSHRAFQEYSTYELVKFRYQDLRNESDIYNEVFTQFNDSLNHELFRYKILEIEELDKYHLYNVLDKKNKDTVIVLTKKIDKHNCNKLIKINKDGNYNFNIEEVNVFDLFTTVEKSEGKRKNYFVFNNEGKEVLIKKQYYFTYFTNDICNGYLNSKRFYSERNPF